MHPCGTGVSARGHGHVRSGISGRHSAPGGEAYDGSVRHLLYLTAKAYQPKSKDQKIFFSSLQVSNQIVGSGLQGLCGESSTRAQGSNDVVMNVIVDCLHGIDRRSVTAHDGLVIRINN